MRSHMVSEFHDASIDEVVAIAQEALRRGWAFVQIAAITREASVELVYTYTDPDREVPGHDAYVVDVPDGTQVPSITEVFPEAFVFENEIHDLFGVEVDGINIDFQGEFYTVQVAYPMNPRAAAAAQEESAKEEDHE